MKSDRELTGLGGWLILVAIGVVLNPIRLLLSAAPQYVPIFTDGTWQALITPTSEFYHPMWAPLIIGEIVFNTALFMASALLVYLFFSKHHRFPLLFIGIVASSLLFQLLDALLVQVVAPEVALFDEVTGRALASTLIAALIWTPYMLNSKRVRLTFTNGRASDGERVAA